MISLCIYKEAKSNCYDAISKKIIKGGLLLDFLAMKAKKSEEFRQKLIAIIQRSSSGSTGVRGCISASNAVTILNFSNFFFHKVKNFKNSKIPWA